MTRLVRGFSFTGREAQQLEEIVQHCDEGYSQTVRRLIRDEYSRIKSKEGDNNNNVEQTEKES